MAKLLHCRNCNSIHSLPASGQKINCDCGKTQAWYSDPSIGFALAHTDDPEDRKLVHLIAVNNGFINDGPDYIPTSYHDPSTNTNIPFPPSQTDTFWRQLHTQAGILGRAPEHNRVWDNSRRACPFAILTPGESIDAQWQD
jgi:hypothetical protein